MRENTFHNISFAGSRVAIIDVKVFKQHVALAKI